MRTETGSGGKVVVKVWFSVSWSRDRKSCRLTVPPGPQTTLKIQKDLSV